MQPAGHAPPSVAHYAVCLTVCQNTVLAQILFLFVPCNTPVFSSRAATQPLSIPLLIEEHVFESIKMDRLLFPPHIQTLNGIQPFCDTVNDKVPMKRM